ncbi:MAG TPA: OB-fold domain-containing protein [Candidatus Thermoplasmatota archaeon]|nr:OB-fold domain-containing protein [Candidatus Thermoplasmatota archaeon]
MNRGGKAAHGGGVPPSGLGVVSVGTAFPRLRLTSDELKAAWGAAPKDIDERCIPAFDEDAFTLAVEASRRALSVRGLAPASVVTIVRTFGGPRLDALRFQDALGAAEAGVVALEPCHGAGVLAAAATLAGPVLWVASSVPDGSPGSAEEARQGAGAVALVLGPGGAPLPATVGVAPWRRLTGDLGAAQPFADVVHALREAKASVAGLAVEESLAGGRRVSYVRTLQERRVLAAADPLPSEPMGAFVPWGTYEASIPARWRLEGARCAACGRGWLPAPTRCPDCGGQTRPHAFAPRGTVHAVTVIGRGAAPSEFAEQQRAVGDYAVAVVELEHGARVVGQVTDVEPRTLKVGDEVEPVLRRLYEQQGAVRYGQKWRPRGA